MDYDCLIVGGGPAGLSAALILGRCLRTVLLCDAGRQRNTASHAIHGLLGHDGTPPSAFLHAAQNELARHACIAQRATLVTAIERQGEGFAFACADGMRATARRVLLATGLVDTLPSIPGVEEFYGTSVHHCLYCDGVEHSGQALLAFGAGDKGAGLALIMRHWSAQVALCCGSSPPCEGMGKRLAAEGVPVFDKGIVELIGHGGKLRAVRFDDGSRYDCAAIFFATGCDQGSAFAKLLGCRRDEKGGIITDPLTEETTERGVYVAGDASRDVLLVAVAVGEGAKAGVAINRALLQEAGLL